MAKLIGFLSGIVSILLWIQLVFNNPYAAPSSGAIATTFFMLYLPACLAIISALKTNHKLMLVAFIWSFPVSLYVYFTPGIFSWFGITSVTYLFSFVLILVSQKISILKEQHKQ